MTPDRTEYTAKMKRQLGELNMKINMLEAKAEEANAEVMKHYKIELAKARKESAQAMAKFEEMKTAGEDSWDKMVAEMEKVRDAFVNSFKYFKSQV